MTQTGKPKQKAVLSALFIEASHALEGRTYIQKLAFLIQQESDVQAFQFEPFDYGPFSRDLYHILDQLIESGYVDERQEQRDNGVICYCYEAGPKIEELLTRVDIDADLPDAAQTVVGEYPTDDLPELVQRVYSECPEMARNSIY